MYLQSFIISLAKIAEQRSSQVLNIEHWQHFFFLGKSQVFTDMEELGVKPDEDTVKKVARTFCKLGEESKQKLVLRKYLNNWKYIHYNGERVKVRRWG